MFKAFKQEYNFERPHEGLDQRTPGSVYAPSTRRLSDPIPTVEYPAHYEVRKVSHGGMFGWHTKPIFISNSLEGEPIGLVEFDDGLWRVYFAHMELGVLNERALKGLRTGKVYAMSPV